MELFHRSAAAGEPSGVLPTTLRGFSTQPNPSSRTANLDDRSLICGEDTESGIRNPEGKTGNHSPDGRGAMRRDSFGPPRLFWTVATAMTAIPSPRPMAPIPSMVVALMETSSTRRGPHGIHGGQKTASRPSQPIGTGPHPLTTDNATPSHCLSQDGIAPWPFASRTGALPRHTQDNLARPSPSRNISCNALCHGKSGRTPPSLQIVLCFEWCHYRSAWTGLRWSRPPFRHIEDISPCLCRDNRGG